MKMLIAVDGSDASGHAVEAVARLARQIQGLEVVLVNVRAGAATYGDLPPFDFESVERAQRTQQEQLLESALTQARACGLEQVSIWTAVGAPAAEIVRAADAQGADQIVLGTHGKGALGSLLLGSVAQRVVHLAKVPVLLVK